MCSGEARREGWNVVFRRRGLFHSFRALVKRSERVSCVTSSAIVSFSR